MAKKKLTKAATVSQTDGDTEADLEVRLAAALKVAFPHLHRGDISDQKRLTIQLGHGKNDIDGPSLWERFGRIDILVSHGGRPLALVEVKRSTVALTKDDYEQARSYALVLPQHPPIFIVTNGVETKLYETASGGPWSNTGGAAEAVQRAFENAAKIAASDKAWAINILMGHDPTIWVPIVRSATMTLILEMTDAPGASGKTFARDLILPRDATFHVFQQLSVGLTFTIVAGPPAIGKTSVLRELALRSLGNDELAVLMLRGTGPGLFQRLSNEFAAGLDWNISPPEVRLWLRRLSNAASGPKLVLVVDGVEPGSHTHTDLEELASFSLGERVRIVLSTDLPEGLTVGANGRTTTALGANSATITVETLALKEFKAAAEVFRKNRIGFAAGSEHAQEYRVPWVLREIHDSVFADPKHRNPAHWVALPPSLAIDFLRAAKSTWGSRTNLLRGYRLLSRADLADDEVASAEIHMEQAHGFVVRQDVIPAGDRSEIDKLKAANWLRTRRHASGEDIVIPTIPAAYLVEFADTVSFELEKKCKDSPFDAGVWLGERLDGVFLGDLIGAGAILSLASRTGSLSDGIIKGLLSIEPEDEELRNGRFAFQMENGRLQGFKVQNGKMWFVDQNGHPQSDPIDLNDDPSQLLSNTTAWMILAQFACLATATVDDDRKRVDATVLLTIGRHPKPLMRASNDTGHFEHDFGELGTVICEKQGVIEPVTLAMARMLSRPWADADLWVDEVISQSSFPLTYRVLTALRWVHEHASDRSDWAGKRLPELAKIVSDAIVETAPSADDKPTPQDA